MLATAIVLPVLHCVCLRALHAMSQPQCDTQPCPPHGFCRSAQLDMPLRRSLNLATPASRGPSGHRRRHQLVDTWRLCDLSLLTLQTVCVYWLKNMCHRGESCGFLHQFDTARMPLCPNFRKHGSCPDADCPFKHSMDDMKVTAWPSTLPDL